MDILIIRHGEAESLSIEVQDDRNRFLTKKGVLTTKALGKMINKLIKSQNYDEIKIVTSPALRTVQTGEIIRKKLNLDNFFVNEELYFQDYYNILPKLTENFSENSLLIICGHNPMISSLLQSLTDIKVDFSKSTSALIKYNKDQSGELKLFIDASFIKKDKDKKSKKDIPKPKKTKNEVKKNKKYPQLINSAENNEPLLETSIEEKHKIFLNLKLSDVKKSFSMLADVYKENKLQLSIQDYNPENIHDMRLSIRKLMTLLDFVKFDLDYQIYDKLLDFLKSQNSELSKIRDLDIFIDNISSFNLGDNAFINSGVEKRNSLLEIFINDFSQNDNNDFEKNIYNLEFKDNIDKYKFIDGYVRDNLALMISESKVFNKKNKDIEIKDIHNLRIIGKKIKNAMELFPDQIHIKLLQFKNNNKDFVKQLGEYHDAEIGIKILDELTLDIKESLDPKLEDEFYKIILEKFISIKKETFEKTNFSKPPWN